MLPGQGMLFYWARRAGQPSRAQVQAELERLGNLVDS
jgi:hypothetical protein